MDRRTLLTILLTAGVFLAWQKYYVEPRMQLAQQQKVAQTTSSATNTGALSATTPGKPTAPSQPLVTKDFPTATGDATISNGGYLVSDWRLKSYRETLDKTAPQVTLKKIVHEDGEVELAFEDPSLAYVTGVVGKLESRPNGSALWSYEDQNIKMTREYASSPDKSYMDVRVTAQFKARQPQYAFITLAQKNVADDKDRDQQDRILSYWTGDSISRVSVAKPGDAKQITTPVKFIAASTRYFVLGVVPQSPIQEPRAQIQPLADGSSRLSLIYPVTGNTLVIPFKVYFGPKDLDLMRSVDPLLAHTVDFGFFEVFALPILDLLKWIYHWVSNYGLAIILLTILIKIVTFPLNYKSMKSMKGMAKLQPKLNALKEKYKDDKEKLNQEMLALMRGGGYNPIAGCIPVLITMPVFFALYRVLYSSIELYQQPFAFWIHDLSAPDPFYVFPILMGIFMFLQQKVTPTQNAAMDPTQARMMQFMPLIFTAFMLKLPSGLTIYMLTNSVVSILQQLYINKRLEDEGHAPGAVVRA